MKVYVVSGLGSVYWFVTEIVDGPSLTYILKTIDRPAPVTLLMSEMEFRARCYLISLGEDDAGIANRLTRGATRSS